MFHISSFLLMWVLYSTFVALVVNMVLLVFLVIFIINGLDIVGKLYIDESEAISGQFQDFTMYQRMGDMDAGT